MSACFRPASSADHIDKNVILRFWGILGNYYFSEEIIIEKECTMSYTLLSFPHDFLVRENKNKLELPRQDQTSAGCHLSLVSHQL